MDAFTDLTGFIEGVDLKGDDFTIHSGDLCFGTDFQTDGGGGQVLQVQLHADGGLAVIHGFFNGFTGSAFHQRNHAGGCVNQQTAGTDFFCGILAFHQRKCFALHTNCNFHGKSLPNGISNIMITEKSWSVNEKRIANRARQNYNIVIK